MAFARPEQESLLRQIGGIGFPTAERERETVEWHVEIFDQLFEVESRHAASVNRGGGGRQGNQSRRDDPVFCTCERMVVELFPSTQREAGRCRAFL